MENKKCTKCGEEKVLSEFPKRSDRPCGHVSKCKACRRAYSKQWANSPRGKAKTAAYVKVYRKSIIFKYNEYKGKAKQRGLQFSLTMEDFKKLWQKPCVFCGSEIETIGIDRKNSSKGYVNGNIIPCCRCCNWMKNIHSVKAFLTHISKIFAHNFPDRLTEPYQVSPVL